MVAENEELPLNLKSAQEYSQTLAEEFPQLRVGCVHGRMKAKEKDAVMSAFTAGDARCGSRRGHDDAAKGAGRGKAAAASRPGAVYAGAQAAA